MIIVILLLMGLIVSSLMLICSGIFLVEADRAYATPAPKLEIGGVARSEQNRIVGKLLREDRRRPRRGYYPVESPIR